MKQVFHISKRERKSYIQHDCKLDYFRAGFEMAEGYRIGHALEVNFQSPISPKILQAIVDGTTNRDLTIKMLTRHDLPLDWSEQQALFLS